MDILKITRIIVAFCAIYIAVIWAWYATRDYIYTRKYPDYNKELSAEMRERIITAKHTIARHRKSRRYPWHYTALTLWGLVPIGISWCVLGLLIFGLYKFITAHLQAGVPDQGEALSPFAMSLLPGGLLAILLSAVTCIYIARAFPNYMNYLTYRIGWGRKDSATRDDNDIESDMNHYARTGQLTAANIHDGQALTRLMFERFTVVWKLFSGIFLAITLYTLSWDIRAISYVTPHGVSNIQSNFWSVKTRPLDQIQSVERKCYIHVDEGRLKVNLDYRLIFIDGHTLIIENHNIATFQDIVKTSQHALHLTPVEFSAANNITQQPSHELCQSAIEREFDVDIHDALKSAFRKSL